jgi:hypothetical protein
MMQAIGQPFHCTVKSRKSGDQQVTMALIQGLSREELMEAKAWKALEAR